eukprot:COSAG02_NODE_27982_length_598_cov_43.517934_2_plen_61_part_00
MPAEHWRCCSCREEERELLDEGGGAGGGRFFKIQELWVVEERVGDVETGWTCAREEPQRT